MEVALLLLYCKMFAGASNQQLICAIDTKDSWDYSAMVVAASSARYFISSEQNFDAWGRRRNPTNWTYGNVGTRPDWLIRGFTGHEHLDVFNLIHMNARLYDPLVSRMLSPDNYVVDPDATQAYNRYSYCLNNPLKYVDPDGNEPISIIVGVAIGMYLGGSVANNSFNPGQWDFSSANTYIGMGVGGLLGGFGGAGVGAMLKAKKGSQLLSSAYSGGLNMFYNYSPDQNVGTILGYFAAGFGAGMIGSSAGAKGAVLANAKASAMFAGGLFNSGVALMAGELTDGYTLAQAFVGGALVGYAGTSYFAKTKAAKKAALTSKYLFGKGSQLGIDGAWTATASDFAFSNRADYGKKSFGDHLLTGFAGFAGGVFSGMALASDLTAIKSSNIRELVGGSMLFGAYAMEYSLLAIGKGDYEKFYRKGWEKKGTIAAHKTFFYSFITNW